MQMIDEWRAYQIPEFPGSERVGFTAEPAASLPDAGYFLYRSDADPVEVIAFYRGALKFYGWEEQRADAKQVLAKSGAASLQVLAEPREGVTTIMLTLLDN
ncbi:MAG: hypothetical protein IT335_04725 [Thermomicrobiales bacterium]|nr:hypothetical protein [Thermomicrobiales bacterium]